MKHVLGVVFVLLLTAPYVHGQGIDRLAVVFTINPDSSVAQSMSFSFSVPINTSANYTVDSRVTGVEVFDGKQAVPSQLVQEGEQYLIKIDLPEPTSTLSIKYVTDSLVFQSDSIRQFFTEFTFPGIVSHMSVQIRLPGGHGIYQNSYRPRGATFSSDGTSIVLLWEGRDISEPVILSVKYEDLNKTGGIWTGVAIAAIIAVIVAAAYAITHFRKKAKESFYEGFRDDEKKVIEYLEMNPVCLQRDIQKTYGFSRAKSTRIISNLEKKGLIRKQRKGRTNRLWWLKK